MFLTDLALSLIKALIWVYSVLTYPIYWILCWPCCGGRGRPSHGSGPKARIVSRSSDEITYRAVSAPCAIREELLKHPDNINTLEKVLALAVKKYGPR